ncbi:ribonuclease H-like protein [Aspergillus eucalypticola CBS 122712]|uniref:ribonuclease H n=1 Tax=Aspergillus eucalypticola (strain CBS 122712 / IBT 29274) TaxID=1448314 RepID=A0A317UTZ9_ASPEC|nr:ribonuclease H-like protein [Aspergillus eucalypticola CBS 122712]PWY65504.1 ribonuclease H-like protein [Aspergillus eucalypticola CBS 122712]
MQRRYQKKRKPKPRQSTPESFHTEEKHSDCRSSPSSRETDISSNSSFPISPQAVSAPNRRFLPDELYPDHFTLSDIEVPVGNLVFLACPGSETKCPHCNRHIYHLDCIVIAIDGACHNNGKNGARASTGLYYGRDHPMNDSVTLSPGLKQTSQVAELAACQRALLAAHVMQKYWDKLTEMAGDGETTLHTVVIKSDSEYLVRGITEWFFKWKANGWTTAKGLPVANEEHFRSIERYVKLLEDEQVIVKFWHVPRKYNQEADKLATSALDGY